MEYITTKEASEKWGLSLRSVQNQCKLEKIPGAVRVQRDWLIPADSERPLDRRRKHIAEYKALVDAIEKKSTEVKSDELEGMSEPQSLAFDFFFSGTLYSKPGTATHLIEVLSSHPSVTIAKTQLAYYQGDIDRAFRFLEEGEIGGSFESRAGYWTLLGVCAMYRGNVSLWKKTRSSLAEIICENEKEREKRDFWLAVYDSAIYDNAAFPKWFRMGKLSVLPREYAPFARLHYIKYLFVLAYDKIRTGEVKDKYAFKYLVSTLPLICEPLISQTEAEGAIITEIQLRLLCAAAYHSAGEDREAALHIDRAIALALPDRLYAPLAENRSPLGLLLDERLKTADRAAYREVRILSDRLLVGWTALHNTALDRDYSVKLTAREREISRLAAYGLSNDEISARLNISLRTVKENIQKSLLKTGAVTRSELSRYI